MLNQPPRPFATARGLDPGIGPVDQQKLGLGMVQPVLGAADPFDERTPYTLKAASGAVHTVYHSRRGGFVNRWNINQVGESVDLIRRVDGGQGNAVNEIWNERFNTATRFLHNPTMSCGAQQPFGIKANQTPFSPVVYFKDTVDGERLVLDACTIPFQFDVNGFEGGAIEDHGGNYDTPMIWHRARQFARVTFDRSEWHRMEVWGYFPRQWDASDGGFVGLLVSGWFLLDYFGAAGALQYYDPATKTAFTVPGWGVDSLNVAASRLSGVIETSAGPTYAYPFTGTDGYGATVLTGTTNGGNTIAVGVLARLYPDSQMRRMTQLTAVEQRVASHPVAGVDVNSGQILFQVSKTVQMRPAGWIGHQWLFTVCVDDAAQTIVKQRIDAMYKARVLDAPQPFIVPKSVTDDLASFGPGYDAPASV